MTLGERLEWLGRMTLLVFILASAAFLSAITAMRIANRAAAAGIASGRGFRDYDDGPACGCGGDSESETWRGGGDAARGRTGFARAARDGLRDAAPDGIEGKRSAAPVGHGADAPQ